MDKVNLNITGMSCGHCQARVTKALEAVPGVSKADVVLESNSAAVEGRDLITADLVKAVIEAGYKAEVAQ